MEIHNVSCKRPLQHRSNSANSKSRPQNGSYLYTFSHFESCSNIALKVNTKLSNKANNAHAWTVQNASLKWVPQLPTMIFGYSLAHGRVNGDPTTAIAGSVCLLSPMQMGQAVRFQKKAGDVIDSAVLKELVRDLAMNFFAHMDEVPERVIVFRDGGSDGSFQNIKNLEVAAVKEALSELNKEANRVCPNSCPDSSCLSCCPTITFIVSNEVSQSDNDRSDFCIVAR